MTSKEISIFHQFLQSRGAFTLFRGALSSYGYETKSIKEYESKISAIMAIRYSFPWDKVKGVLDWEVINDAWEDICIKHGFYEDESHSEYDIKLNIQGLFQSKQNLLRECTKCHRFLPESSFYTRRSTGGLQSQCIECCREHGRLRNGSTGIYREGNNLKDSDMEDFTFYDFTSNERGRRLQKNQFSINHKKGNFSVTFCIETSKQILDRELMFVRIRKDNITGDLHFIFNKQTGCKISVTGKSSKNVTIINKEFAMFFVKELRLSSDSDRDIAEHSNNLSNSGDYLTYKIIINE